MRSIAITLLLAGCQTQMAAQVADPGAAAPDDDPLAVTLQADSGSLDDLYRSILQPSCASQPGACHAGQFEPNLSTPALAYANLVLRPALEHEKQLRVKPGDPDHSLLIDKLRNRGVGTRMPLGAPPLDEARLGAIEAWIRDGALRRPGADPVPQLNNPPRMPEIAFFDATGKRLDGTGTVAIAAGQTLVMRHGAHDFETPDDQMPVAGFFVTAADGRQVVIDPGSQYAYFGFAGWDPGAPMGLTQQLGWRFPWTVPTQLTLLDADGKGTNVPATGMRLTVIAYYVDQNDDEGVAAYAVSRDVVEVK